MSKDIKPKIRIGQKRSLKRRIAGWTVAALACGGAGLAAYRLTGPTEVDVAVAKVRRADFVFVNDGTLEELDAFVAGVMQELTAP